MAIKMLIVDDSTETTTVLKMLYKSHSDIDVVESASNRQEAIWLCESGCVDLISIDINLGEESGFALCQEIRQRYPRAFITMCSLEADKDYLRRADDAGANYFLAKPITFTDVLALIDTYKDFHSMQTTQSKHEDRDATSLHALFGKINLQKD